MLAPWPPPSPTRDREVVVLVPSPRLAVALLLVTLLPGGCGGTTDAPAGSSTGHFVCGFDRAGSGGSDPAAEARRTASDTADDLLAGVDALGLPLPLVLVAHSAVG